MKINTIILSWDFVISIIITLVTTIILPSKLNIEFCISFYNIGITVLSIVFSLFFAALAIIITSSDNEFIEFLEEENDFTALINTFKVTLLMLFISLLYSIVIFVISNYFAKLTDEPVFQSKIYFLIFEFLFSYSLISTALSIKDTIVFSEIRTKFLKQKNQK